MNPDLKWDSPKCLKLTNSLTTHNQQDKYIDMQFCMYQFFGDKACR